VNKTKRTYNSENQDHDARRERKMQKPVRTEAQYRTKHQTILLGQLAVFRIGTQELNQD